MARLYGTGKKTAADGTLRTRPLKPAQPAPSAPAAREESAEQRVARLEARVGELVSRFQFVADHQDTFEVKRLCELVETSRSSSYAWKAGAPARAVRAGVNAELAEKIRAIHATDNTVGTPRVTAALNDSVAAEERVNHKRVARVMREHGIRGYQRRRRVRTTVPEPSRQKVPDLLKQDFTAPAPNRRYVGDITYLPLADGQNLYLATVIDRYSRRLVGWSLAEHMRTSLVEHALKAAAATRGAARALAGAILHSDHGSVHASKDYANLCPRLRVTQSMGAVGTSADNAPAESFSPTLKREVLQDNNLWPDETTCRRQGKGAAPFGIGASVLAPIPSSPMGCRLTRRDLRRPPRREPVR